MKARIALIAGLAAMAALAAPVSAAPAPQVVDMKGDANGANGQGRVDDRIPSNNNPTPGSQDGYDVVSVMFETLRDSKGKPANLVVTMELVGKPSTTGPSIFRVMARTDNCATVYFQYRTALDSAPASTLEYCSTSSSGLSTLESLPVSTFAITDNKLRWTVPLAVTSSLPVRIAAGTTLKALSAQTLMNFMTTDTAAPVGIARPAIGVPRGSTVQVDAALTEGTYTIG